MDKVVKQNKYRWSICVKNDEEAFVCVDGDVILEGIFKFKNKWDLGYALMIDQKINVVADFNSWKKAKAFTVQGKNGKEFIFTEKDVVAIKNLIKERDKRLSLN